jgi:hypothetical protein
MKNNLSILIAVGFVITGLLSCDKTPVGYSELERDISEATFIELRTTDRSCYGKHTPLGNTSYLVLGKNANYQSRVLIQFALSDTLLDSVQSIKLALYPKLHKEIKFKIHPVIKASEWRQAHATWLRMDENVPWLTDGGDYYPTVLAETTLTPDSCIIDLKLNKLDSLVNYASGIILVPDDTSSDFAMLYAREYGSNKPAIIYQFVNYNEIYYATEDCHIIDTTNLDLGMFDYWIGAGFPYRTLLKFPVKESLPANVTIAYAELILPVAQYFSMFDTISIGVKKITDSLPFGISTRFADYLSARTDYLVTQDSIIKIDVRNIVQFWNQFNGSNNQPDSCFGILLSGYPEEYGIFRLQLKTTAPGIRLKIGYINPPQGRF